ncbi:Myosin-15 [Vitis vinifera]|uniref:Myosin-15 n=1 Tax=Vitis vinifera TaxID=29760 RepID=A0A438EX17_VITVI|nr:Myosin-15 [Vitis vinifera]
MDISSLWMFPFIMSSSVKDAEKYKLGKPDNFHYLNQSKSYELEGVSNGEEYMKTRRAMGIVAIFRTLAAILHLGNVEFSPGKEHDSSVLKDQKSNFHIQMAADLFILRCWSNKCIHKLEYGVQINWCYYWDVNKLSIAECDVNLLRATLCTRTIQTREGDIIKALDCNAAVASRDALAKTVYAKLFDWLVEKVNRSVGQDLNSRVQIGVLDIYGFECFKHNSDLVNNDDFKCLLDVVKLPEMFKRFITSYVTVSIA